MFIAFDIKTRKSQQSTAVPGQIEQAVKDAIDVGYRHIDSAYLYGNEKEIGNAVRAKIAEGVIRREDIFITTKVSSNDALVSISLNGIMQDLQ